MSFDVRFQRSEGGSDSVYGMDVCVCVYVCECVCVCVCVCVEGGVVCMCL